MLENIPLEVISAMLDTLPEDITFIDENDVIRYFNACRIFKRPPEIIGTPVQQCHQQSSQVMVNRVLQDLRSGRKGVAEFPAEKDGRHLRVRYFAVRNKEGHYLGCLEVVDEPQ